MEVKRLEDTEEQKGFSETVPEAMPMKFQYHGYEKMTGTRLMPINMLIWSRKLMIKL